MFYHTQNLTKQSVTKCVPWEFGPVDVPDDVRHNKAARQTWYKNPELVHSFYTGFEGLNPNARVSTSNPVFYCGGLVADVDHPYSEEEVREVVKKLPAQKPQFIEKSLGGNWRFVWVLNKPVRFPANPELSAVILKSLAASLGLTVVKGFEERAWLNPTRLYCQGGEWHQVDLGNFLESDMESVVFNSANELAKRSKSREVVLSRVEDMIKEKWPNWTWPSDFVLGSQGPTWWVEGSTSDKSAIVHAEGMYTFSGHAEKDWWSWNDILGPGAIEKNIQEQIKKSVSAIYYDGLNYFSVRSDGGFQVERIDVVRRRMTVQYGLRAKAGKGTDSSEVDQALNYIESVNRVDGAGPCLYRPSGVIRVSQGQRFLNTLDLKPLAAAEDPQQWGEQGRFPFISDWFGKIFWRPEPLSHFLSWFHLFYKSAVNQKPRQGHAIFLSGGVGIGKSLLTRWVIGHAMGGYADAAPFLMGEDSFGGELFSAPVWSVDDQTMTKSSAAQRAFTHCIKKAVANRAFRYHEKYRMAAMVEWLGRVMTTCNLDAWSQKVLPAMEDSVKDKICLYKLISNSGEDSEEPFLPASFFPENVEEILKEEMPFFLRWLLDYEIPKQFQSSARFGITAYHDEGLVDSAYHNSGSAAAQEIVTQFFHEFLRLREEGELPEWRGTASELMRQMGAIPGFDMLLRGTTAQSMQTHLANLTEFPALDICCETDEDGLRVFIIRKPTHEND